MGVASEAITKSGRGNCKGLNYAATETVSEADAMLLEGEKKKNELEKINIEHFTLNDNTAGRVVNVQWHKRWSKKE